MAEKLFIQELSIKNFRLFKSLQASGFGQINLITGRNNSGKTTFLEALFLCLGPANPQLWININSRRGIRRVGKNATTIPYLFSELNIGIPIVFDVSTKNHSSYRLEIEAKGLGNEKKITSQDDDQGSLYTNFPEANSVLVTTYQPHLGNPITAKTIIDREGITVEGERLDIFPTCIFISAENLGDTETDAKRYDDLNKKGLVPKFEQLLKPVLPKLKRTSLGIENDIPVVLADVGYGLVPISLLGSGSKRLVSVLLALANARNAIVLIDEVEYGFHHSLLESIWEAVINFSQLNHVQVFATTHSDECIRAASSVFSKHKNSDFRLLRLASENGQTEIKSFSISQLDAALESGLDVR